MEEENRLGKAELVRFASLKVESEGILGVDRNVRQLCVP